MRASLSKRRLLFPLIMALMIGFLGMTPTAAVAAGSLVAPAPTVSGSAVVGKKLIAVPGKWTAGTTLKYQWLRSGVAVKGATASTLTLGGADLGKKISVKVTGSKGGYKSVAKTSRATAAVAAGSLVAPVPTVSGSLAVGKKLSVVPGKWTSGTTLKYQWLRSGVAVKGATASSLTLSTADRGKKISVKVAGSKAGYKSVAKTSRATPAVAAGSLVAPVPAVSGSAVVGKKLTAVPGKWTTGTTLKYQWLRSGVAISGATTSAVTLGSADRGKTMSVRVTGSKAGYKSVARTSRATPAVAASSLVAPVPAVSGSAVVGKKLTAVPGKWTAGTTLKYQWLRSGVVLKGATASSLTLGSADRGKTMSVRVTGSKAGYKSVAKTSRATPAVAAPPSKIPSLSDPMVAESFKLVNDYRAKNKLKVLRWNPNLATWSQKWADHLHADFVSPRWAENWHNQTFYNNYPLGWSGAGENVALNTKAKTMFDFWVNSPDHKQNMLNPNFTDFGFGYARYTSGDHAGLSMGVQNFARY